LVVIILAYIIEYAIAGSI